MSWRHHAPIPMIESSGGGQVPAEIAVVEHSVGYTEVVLTNGDRLRLRLFVDKFTFDPECNTYTPTYRVVSEVQVREVRGDIHAVLEECWRC